MKVRLGDICTITSAKRIFESEYVSEGVPFIRGLEITDGSVLNEKAKFRCYISEERYEQLKQSNGVPQKGDLLITAVGTIGNLCYIDNDRPFYFKDGNVIWFKNFDERVYSEFLYYFMECDYFKKQLEYSMIGAVQKALTMVMLMKIELDLPDLNTQLLSVRILEAIDAKIRNNNNIIVELEAMAKTIYDYWFLQFDFPNETGKPYKSSGGKMVWNEDLKRNIPAGWKVKPIGNLLDDKRGISYSSKTIEGDGVPMINLASFSSDGQYNVQGLKVYSGDYTDDKVLKPYDLVICNTQQTAIDFKKDIIGKALLVPDIFDGDIVFSHHVTALNVYDNDIKYYLFRMFNTNYFHKFISGCTNGTNILGLLFDSVKRCEIEIPDKGTLAKFAKIIHDIESKKANVIKENEELVKLRNFLLPMLMSGQIQFDAS